MCVRRCRLDTADGAPLYVVLGARGFVGSAVCAHLKRIGVTYLPVGRETYRSAVGTTCDVLVNCAGNARRFWASEHPDLDLEATVLTAMRALFDFKARLFVQMSSVDVYPRVDDPALNAESVPIAPDDLSPYGLHKWMAETLVRRYARNWLVLRLGGLVGDGLKKNPIFDALHGVPLRLTADSELGFIDTAVVARILTDLIEGGVKDEIYNVCGTGTVRMSDLAELLSRPVVLSADGEQQLYRVNNTRLRQLHDIPQSRDAVLAFARRWLGAPT